MIRLRRVVSIVGSIVVVAGLVAAIALRTAAGAPAALAATTVQGTDVYGQTAVTSWPDVLGAGMSFVGIQAYNGATVPNTNYDAQVTGALGEGLYVMPYVFADPLKIAGGAQFTKAWSVIDSVTGAPYAAGGQLLPIALDLESDSAVTSDPCYGLTQPQMVSWISAFIAAAKADSVSAPVIYTNPGWWLKCTGNSTAFSADPLWDADYDVTSPQLPPGWTDYTFWQSSDEGTVAGITGAADLDQLQQAPAVSATVGVAGSLQVATLNSLAGQPVSYHPAVPLPHGVTLTAGGLLSWSSATPAGSYLVRAIPVSAGPPAATMVPAEIDVNLIVHGKITLWTANRSVTAGSPVSLAIPWSGPDAQEGDPPTLTVTGLPPGLSLTSPSLVTGWPSKPGTYHVTVRAVDALGGTASASFTYAVKAAADTGTTGQVRQVGGSGKCLNDPAGKTANGTLVNLWSCDGKSNQQWTAVQDGTLRLGGKCVATVGNSQSDGAKLDLESCNSANGAQLWQAAADGQLVNPQSGKCLDVQAASAANGIKPVLEPCANSASAPNEHWLRPAAAIASASPGTCLASSGIAVRLDNCANVTAQHWQPRPDGTIRSGGECLAETGTTAGAAVSVVACSGAAATKWQLLTTGPIATQLVSAASGLCASATSNLTRKVVLAACASNPATTWHIW